MKSTGYLQFLNSQIPKFAIKRSEFLKIVIDCDDKTVRRCHSTIISRKGDVEIMVRSIDVQQVLSQSSAVERVQQVQQQQADIQQRHFEAQLAKEKKELKEKVKDLEESERLMLREEEERDKREKNRENRAKMEKEGADDADGDVSVDKPRERVDITV